MWARSKLGFEASDPGTLGRVSGFWPIFFLLVVLKIPVLGSLWLVWWASREPEPEGAADDGDGGFKRRNPEPKLPRGPRRGPHGGGVGGVAKRRRGAPLEQRRPLFRLDPTPRTAISSPGEKPSKQEGHPASSPHLR
jgi:hypothetical protein